MSLHLVYIGAVADSAPAASLRALEGGGAVFVPHELPPDLRELIEAAVGARLRAEIGVADATSLCVQAAGDADGELLAVCIAGPGGPPLARAVRAAAAARGLTVTSTPPGDAFGDCLIAQELVSLRHITRVLRRECPWDREQSAMDIVTYTIEEVYELADAIAGGRHDEEHGELGDLLFQVYFLSALLEEERAGDLGSVAAEIEAKLIRRHAHIFGDAVAETPGEVRGQWEHIKRTQEGREGVFHNVPATLPALLLARKVQQRAAAVGFDWDDALQAFPKIAEEHAELAELLNGPLPAGEHGSSPLGRLPARLRHEFGDLLFAVVNVARKAGIDPELALREAAARFRRRIDAAGELAQRENKEWTTLGLDDQEQYYRRAKSGEGDLYDDEQEGEP